MVQRCHEFIRCVATSPPCEPTTGPASLAFPSQAGPNPPTPGHAATGPLVAPYDQPKRGGRVSYDVVVIGAGAGGEAAGSLSAQLGRRVAVVERELVGGLCSFWACLPSKTLLDSAAR
ncbi:MAG: FAD-dependent oxidoreductase, partial [Actinomycetota bacterium]